MASNESFATFLNELSLMYFSASSSAVIIMASTSLDPAAVARQVDAVLADPLYWFPVRHHSHTVARQLASALRSRKPKIIFIEGPYEANDLIPFVVDAKTEPPVAIYSSYRDDANVLGLNGIVSPAADIPARFAVWYPLTTYSPEYVALKAATTLGAEAVFIDLPHHALLKPHGTPEVAAKPPPATDDETLITTSGFYQQLAAAAGFKSWDEAWDTLFENPHAIGDHTRHSAANWPRFVVPCG